MAEKQSNKERIKEITAGIEKGIQELFESDRYRNYLTTMSRVIGQYRIPKPFADQSAGMPLGTDIAVWIVKE